MRFNPFDAAFQRDPYPTYAQMRQEAPIYRTPGFRGEWLLTRYHDVYTLLRDSRLGIDPLPNRLRDKQRFLSAKQEKLETLSQLTGDWLFFNNPPDHTRLRRLVTKAFSHAAVEKLRPQIEQLTTRLLEPLAGRSGFDFMAEVAKPLPRLVIGGLLGVSETGLAAIQVWSPKLVRIFDAMLSLEQLVELNQVAGDFRAYMQQEVAARVAAPGDDLLSQLAAVRDEGDRLSEEELLAMGVILFTAGGETSSDLLGSGLYTLLCYPQQLQKLRQNPALINSAVEEMLRFESPTQLFVRATLQPVMLEGYQLAAGERVLLGLAAANRDPARFADPDRFDICRSNNAHVAFGAGIHFCLGAALARAIAQTVFPLLLSCFPELSLAGEQVEWRTNLGLRGPTRLEVTTQCH